MPTLKSEMPAAGSAGHTRNSQPSQPQKDSTSGLGAYSCEFSRDFYEAQVGLFDSSLYGKPKNCLEHIVKVNKYIHRDVYLTGSGASVGEQAFCTSNPRKMGIKGSSSLQKSLLFPMPGSPQGDPTISTPLMSAGRILSHVGGVYV